jgi:hypothetical protein
LEALQAQSLAARKSMIEEAKLLGAAPVLRVDAVKALQQRWQAEAHRVPIDRRQEQKLWDAFRKPIDDAFNRKTAEREQAESALSARDKVVIDAAKALEAANASGDATRIRQAITALDAALKGQAQAQADVKVAGAQEIAAQAAVAPQPVAEAEAATAELNPEGSAGLESGAQTTPAPVPPKPAPKPVVAVRGDDRPGMKKEAPAAPLARGGKWNDRKDAPRGGRDAKPPFGPRGDDRPRAEGWQEAPRLGDAAFRAQRDALENAQYALKKLAAQAHGEALTQLLTAWEKRDAAALPTGQDLGPRVTPPSRATWQQAVAGTLAPEKGVDPAVALLRLEMAAEVPTPAEQLNARRMLQLQLLTRRNDPAPLDTWSKDTAVVLSGDFNAADARRLQNALKVLLKR